LAQGRWRGREQAHVGEEVGEQALLTWVPGSGANRKKLRRGLQD
jgi:hypothetical protein